MNLGATGEEMRKRHLQGVKFNAIGLAEGGEDVTEWTTNIERLASLVKVEPADLEKQLLDILPLALELQNVKGLQTHEAWASATTAKIKNAIKNNKDKTKHNCFNGAQSVCQYQSGWSLSTCGVEELIAEIRATFTNHCKSCQTTRWADECEIICGKELCFSDDLIAEEATKLFVKVYGAYRRSHCGIRCDTGSVKQKAENRCADGQPESIAGFKRVVDAEVRQAVNTSTVTHEEITALLGQDPVWSCDKVAK